MRFLCVSVLYFLLLSLCDGQLIQGSVVVPGFSCRPLSAFQYGCNSCVCNSSGSAAQCMSRPGSCPEETRKVKKRPEKVELCTPGQKKKDGCIECICTASTLWACTKADCNKPVNTNGIARRAKLYSYECKKTVQQSYQICETRSRRCGIFEMNINYIFFFRPNIITIQSFCMKPVCHIVTVLRKVKYVCPEIEDTLELDETEAEDVPDSTTMSPHPEDHGVDKTETTAAPIETSPRDTENDSSETTTGKPDDIDASVEMGTTPENQVDDSEDTTKNPDLEEPDDSGKVQKQAIEESGDTFTADDFDRDDFECKPDKSFRIECNTCWCKSDGLGARYCTRIACKAKIYKPLIQQ